MSAPEMSCITYFSDEEEENQSSSIMARTATQSVLYYAHRLIQRSAVLLVIASDTLSKVFSKCKSRFGYQDNFVDKRRCLTK